MAANPINDFFVNDASRIVGEIASLMRVTGRLSALMPRGEAEEGKGFNFQSVLWDRSQSADNAVWVPVQANAVTNNPNTCNPDPLQVDPASTTYNYALQETMLRSNEICFWDVRAGYDFVQQVEAIRNNFKALVVDVWERQDKLAFFQLPGHKVVCNASMTDYYGQSDFGTALPTSRLTAGILHYLYQKLIRNAAGEEPVATKDGQSQFMMLLGPEAQQDIIQNSPEVRQDIRFAQMGEGETGWLLQTWNADRPYAGFLLIVDVKMPRWTFNAGTGQWVEVPYYISVPATKGFKLIPNPAYDSAPYEDAYIFLKQTIRRDMPRPFGSGGADMKFDPVNFNGDILWKNFLTDDNPLGLKGRYYAPLAAAWRPGKPLYAYVVRHCVCPSLELAACY